MKARPSGSRRVTQRARPRIVSGEMIRSRSQEIGDAVAQRAYAIFEQRGRADGHHDEDWRQAESELVFPLAVTVADAGRNLTVEAAVPGFDPYDVEVCVEPRRVTIAGQRLAGSAPDAELRRWMLRAVELPEDVETSDVTAVVEEGFVSVTLRKVTGAGAGPDAAPGC
jgi:HSP20 family molecular chaperone IbpA